ncbi:MAG TPA: DUF2007 domain-containing protein [Actinomycetota bacterium]|nr:DUF2007 domain-containing protein [Actinomycetota bacterium]
MHCPSCGDEFRPGVTTTCPDCGVALVDGEVAPAPRHRFDPRDVPELVEIYSTGPHEAEIVRALLEDAGIPAITAGEGYASAYPVTVGALGERRVLVRRDDAERAAEVIRDALEES